jgi:hypothetical protein
MYPENGGLSPYLDNLSSVVEVFVLKSSISFGDNAFGSGDKLDIITEEENKSNDDTRENPDSKTDSLIGYRKPFYYCKEHPDVENIHRETIEQHIFILLCTNPYNFLLKNYITIY